MPVPRAHGGGGRDGGGGGKSLGHSLRRGGRCSWPTTPRALLRIPLPLTRAPRRIASHRIAGL